VSHIWGIDIGLKNFGLSIYEIASSSFVDVRCIRTDKAAKTLHRYESEDIVRRGVEISTVLSSLVETYPITCIATEGMSWPRNSSAAAKMGVTVGITCMLSTLGKDGRIVPVFTFQPKEIKIAVCDDSSATKEQVQGACMARHPELVTLVKLPKGTWEHQYDASAAVLTLLQNTQLRFMVTGQ
jgi:Holliday junction resolvasome RuvABC endonuclease subunit